MPRTTLKLPHEILREAKMEAAERRVPLHQIVTEALKLKYKHFPYSGRVFKIRTEKLGRDTSTYRREEIYEDTLKHRVRQ